VTVVRRGQLAAVGLVAADDQPGVERLLAGPRHRSCSTGPPPRHLADEVNLVTRWLEGAAGKAELLAVRGRLASPAIGGRSSSSATTPAATATPGRPARPAAAPRPAPPAHDAPPPRRRVRRRRFGERLADPVPGGTGRSGGGG
jgi:pyruvate/2-oxoglutarate dehydrogenase complex dihydrolipoamide acyltransferase (E2) component